jgi:O-antigen/teichoic acid export membrane protein
LVLAPFLAWYFNTQELTYLIPIAGVIIFIRALGNHFLVYAQKELLFKSIAVIEIAININRFTKINSLLGFIDIALVLFLTLSSSSSSLGHPPDITMRPLRRC